MEDKKYFGSKFYSSRINTALLFILIILMIIALRFMYKNQETYLPFPPETKSWNDAENKAADEYKEKVLDRISGNKDDLISFSISPDSKVKGIISYSGVVKGGYFFEGNILVNVLDGNKKVILKGHGTATGDWMTDKTVDFEGNIDFTNLKKGQAYIEIQNDDPSDGEGGPAKKIFIPIIIE